MKFSNVSHLKRDRSIEGETGVDLKVSNDIYLVVLAASDANPRWRENSQKALAELKRLAKAGEPPAKLQRRYAELYASSLVIGWHGGFDDMGNRLPGGPRDEAADPVPFNRENCIDFLTEADDAITALDETVFDTKNFRAAAAGGAIETIKNV